MGKKNKKFDSIEELTQKKKEIDSLIRKRSIPCPHTNKSGDLKVEFHDGSDVVTCKKCGEVFSIREIDKRSLNDAIKLVKSAINQCKIFSQNPEEEQSLISNLGKLAYSLSEVGELYNRTLNDNKKGKKKKHRNDNYCDSASGDYGYGTLLGGSNKKKHKKRW